MLTTMKSVYVLGEPVLMKVSVHNAGDEPERVLLMFSDCEHRFRFHFRNEKGEVYSRRTGLHASIMGEVRERDGFPLGPGETRYGFSTAYRGRTPRGGLVFPEAGQYDIWWEFTGWSNPLTSNPVRITVRDPVGVDAEAFETFTHKSTSMLVGTQARTFLGHEHKAEALNSWRITLAKWPGSTYAPYALFFLATHERWHGDPGKAVELYEELLNAYEPFAYTEVAEFYMLDCHRELGADDFAGRMLHELASKYPGSDLANPIQLGPQTPEWELRQATIEER